MQTDTGWPKKVSRRVQDVISDDLPLPIVDADRISPCALAGVCAAEDFATHDNSRWLP